MPPAGHVLAIFLMLRPFAAASLIACQREMIKWPGRHASIRAAAFTGPRLQWVAQARQSSKNWRARSAGLMGAEVSREDLIARSRLLPHPRLPWASRSQPWSDFRDVPSLAQDAGVTKE